MKCPHQTPVSTPCNIARHTYTIFLVMGIFLGSLLGSVARYSLLVLSKSTNLSRPALAFTIVDCVNKPGVVPVLDHIVRPIVNLNLYSISTIVNQEDDGPLSASQHCRHILCGHLASICQL